MTATPPVAPAPAPDADLEALAASMRRNRRRRRMRETGVAAVMLAPSLVVFVVFIYYPFVKNFQLGFYRASPFPGQPDRWAGLDQWREVLTSDAFRRSLWATVQLAILTVPVAIVLGVLLAVLAHQKLKGMAVYRFIFSSTIATSVAVASVIFLTLLNPQIGLANYYLGRIGEASLLQDSTWALPMVSLVTVWAYIGLVFILMSAGLQAIPDEMFEAARVDGAGPWRQIREVVVPLLSPTIFFAAVIGLIYAWQTFAQVDLLTQGGPPGRQGATNVLTYFVFVEWQRPDRGTAGILAVALFVIVMVLTLLQIRFLERRVHYAR